jgi:hypothetical protein
MKMLKFESIIEIPMTNIFNREYDPLNGVITSINWGLVPLGIVLMLQAPEDESENSPHYCCFIVFDNVIDYELPLCKVNTSTGGLLVDFFFSYDLGIQTYERANQTYSYPLYSFEFHILRSDTISSDCPHNMHRTMKISATCNPRCFRTVRSTMPLKENAWLPYSELMSLFSDKELKEFIELIQVTEN